MAEPPNVEQIAQEIIKRIWGNDVDEDSDERVKRMLVDRLREVWNARGAADVKGVENRWDRYDPPDLQSVKDAIKGQDR